MKPVAIAILLAILIPFTAQAQVLRVGVVSDISTLDPHLALDTISSAVLYNVFENLVAFEKDSLEIIPALARSWKHSDDFTVYTYELRRNAVFHDGTPLTADIVINSFKTVPNFTAKISKIGPMTVRFYLAEPDSHFNDFLAQPYYGVTAPSKKGAGHPNGSGPYRFKSWDRGREIVIEANPKWWGGRVAVKEVHFLVYPDEAAIVDALAAKEIDLAEWLTSESILKLRKHPHMHVETRLGSNTAFLSMNTKHALLSDINVRKAIAHSINIVQLTRKFFPGASGAPASTIIPPTLYKALAKPLPYDPVHAKKLIEAAKVDTKKPIRLLEAWAPRPYMPDPHGIALEIKKFLEEVGLTVTIERDPAHYFDRIRSGDLDLCLNGWIADNGDPVEFISANFSKASIGHNNVSRWTNSEFEKILSRARAQDGYALKISLNNALQIFHREMPAVPLFWGAQSAAWNRRVKNYAIHPSSQMILSRVRIANNGAGK